MSAPSALTSDSIALQLEAALDQYDRDTGSMIAAWPDLELYRSFSESIEKIRLYSSGIPEARVQWVELLIAHAELVHFLWRTQYGNQPAALAEIGAVREHHSRCVSALRERCLRVVAHGQQRRADRGAVS
ncbi:MAG TPA: hypothetical protein VHL79_13310 [Ramlibacter sp.]|jgi:hypothetical protein|nr:hypothetical protein [Ramlibacter sp.]